MFLEQKCTASRYWIEASPSTAIKMRFGNPANRGGKGDVFLRGENVKMGGGQDSLPPPCLPYKCSTRTKPTESAYKGFSVARNYARMSGHHVGHHRSA